MLPPVRRKRRRDWGRIVARVFCVLFAIVGMLPVGVGLLVRTSWARSIATAEARKVVASLGVDDATFDVLEQCSPVQRATLVAGEMEGLAPLDLELVLDAPPRSVRRRLAETRRVSGTDRSRGGRQPKGARRERGSWLRIVADRH